MSEPTLVTFLGKAQADPKTGYRRARYRFPDGAVAETPFFGLALRRQIGARRLVVLGTAGSMWDILVEHVAAGSAGSLEEARLELVEAAERQIVDSTHLERLRPLLEEGLGCACELVLIPYGRSPQEQEMVLDELEEAVGPSEREVHFDLTHGLRHLAMLGLVAARLLEVLRRGLSVEAVWYGAFELRGEDDVVPVLRLDGLVRLQEWIEAWRRFDDDGDYAVFADLIELEGGDAELAEGLRRAAYFESVLNLPDARRRLLQVLERLERPLPGAGRLFTGRLRERLAWARQGDLYQHQRRLAALHLAKGDYLRAAVLINEAVLTRWMAERGEGDVHQQPDRESARKRMLEEMGEARRDAEHEDFRTLEALRNALAHGSVPRWRKVRDLLQSESRLQRELQRILSRLLS